MNQKKHSASPLNHILYTTRLLNALFSTESETNKSRHIPSYLTNIKNAFDQKYYDYFSLDLLEKQYHVNKYKIAKEFTFYYGTSPINYLTQKRIEAAKILLMTTKERVHEIGRKVGYENTNHFINSFKKITGVTPLIYRKNMTL